jgi:hypothetical protein
MGGVQVYPPGGKRLNSSTDVDIRTIPPAHHTIVALSPGYLLATKKNTFKKLIMTIVVMDVSCDSWPVL